MTHKASDTQNVAIMHQFVDLLDFSGVQFVDALRAFLQKFRLPGESQKIDRFVLKFAERYIDANPKTAFANAGVCIYLKGSFETILTPHRNGLCALVLRYHAQHRPLQPAG